MSDPSPIRNGFLKNVTEIIEANITNEQFGVSELASEMGMSRSNLLRKIKKLTNQSASQFIREVRLSQGFDLLKETSFTVSEVSYKVGFGSTSYFIKCFREYYGFPPGETVKNTPESTTINSGNEAHTHQLVAIMFTDIQGYTALMQKDEEQAVAFRNRHREVFNSSTNKFKGKILQYYGDGTLSTFGSAIDAVRCGIELQLKFREEPRIPVRIGIHSGDIIFTDDDIIGDGVNVASRIESLAAAQSVLISEKVYDEVKNQSSIQTSSLGTFELKNVGKPMEIFAISNPGLIVPQRDQMEGKLKSKIQQDKKEARTNTRKSGILWVLIPLIVMLAGYAIYSSGLFESKPEKLSEAEILSKKKSVAVLPFINDSNDSTNVYIINGVMESILNNLQKIKDLRVISRTSVEKYRNNPKIISEIARELNVRYFVEGSGQKIGNQILLHVQLIDANTDKHLWAGQYEREAKDIFKLQSDVAKHIAGEIEVYVTPEVEQLIDKVPTENLVAYDHFLKGLDLFYSGKAENLPESIVNYKKAIEEDEKFARAYAGVAISYYFLDYGHPQKQYTELINEYADKALLHDPQLAQSLIAKALYYMQTNENEKALPFLENALSYNPNSSVVLNILAEFYTSYSPNTEKYLKYALKGIQLDIAANDSLATSYIYLHVSNALVQSGFVDEALTYINKSISFSPENLYSAYVKAFILLAKNGDFEQTKIQLLKTFQRDTTRLDILQEIGKICYFMRDYESAWTYYEKFDLAREAYDLDIYRSENAKIAVVLSKIGKAEASEKFFDSFKEYADYDQSVYKSLSLSVYYANHGEIDMAIEQLRIFSQQDNYHYWTVMLLDKDPLIDPIKDHPEFKELLKKITDKFWDKHKETKEKLINEDLI